MKKLTLNGIHYTTSINNRYSKTFNKINNKKCDKYNRLKICIEHHYNPRSR